MKKGIFFQIVIITIILLVWNVIHLGYKYQKNLLEEQLAGIPMILISQNVGSLYSLRSEIDSLEIIKEIIVESDSVIARNLMSHYQIEEAESLLGDFHLPSIMKIFFTGKEFSSTAKLNLEDHIISNYPQIVINYDNNFWVKSDRKILLLAKSYYYGNGFLALFLIVTIIFLRLFYESKHHEYWRIYRNSGGKRKKRRQQFFSNSLLICLLPIILNCAAYFALQYYNYLPMEIDLRFFAAEFGIVVFSVLLSRLFLGKNL
ncbi:MAG: hypothetical protein Q7J16_13605 [Candidatus Cloacimonadales bacterium]|nr:hypothetical protein [Candidatus Cloacimonadales bacterium]